MEKIDRREFCKGAAGLAGIIAAIAIGYFFFG